MTQRLLHCEVMNSALSLEFMSIVSSLSPCSRDPTFENRQHFFPTICQQAEDVFDNRLVFSAESRGRSESVHIALRGVVAHGIGPANRLKSAIGTTGNAFRRPQAEISCALRP